MLLTKEHHKALQEQHTFEIMRNECIEFVRENRRNKLVQDYDLVDVILMTHMEYYHSKTTAKEKATAKQKK